MSVAETDGLPYMLPLAVGYPYMITSNIDVADGLVNGAIGVLLYIERQPANADDRSAPGGPSTSTSLPPAEDEIATLWFQFEDKNTGTKAKIKCRPHVHSKPNTLSVDWVPVHKKVVNISLTKTVKCKRKQFPCVPACAITIHKAQGGTFTTIVYKYSSKQPQQLVYVAMSRVTSIDGLYIITEKDSPLVFKHGRDGNDSQTTRDIRNEYLRLRGHTLDTITKQAVKFCDDATDAGQLIVTNINCQSLSAHAADIETDTVIPRSDYLVLTETWMRDTCEPTPIKGYECVSRENNRPNSDTNAAGGVAIYRKLSSTSTAEVFQVAITDVTRVIKTKGDMCMTEVTCFAANTSFKFILGAVYIHPGASMQDIGMLLWQGLGPYIHNSQYVPPPPGIGLTVLRRLWVQRPVAGSPVLVLLPLRHSGGLHHHRAAPDLQGWVFGRGLDDDALAILTSAKTRIYKFFLGVELRSVQEDLVWRRTLSRTPKFQRTDENMQKITDLIKENPRTTLLELEQDTGTSKTTIGRIVTEDLKLKKTPAKFIPRFLTNEQKLCRLATCEYMFEMSRTDPEWKDKIITGDETWVYGYDPETKRQSVEWRGQDIAPNDFFLFPKLKAVIKGRHFDTRDE
ncbi:hypothetical protein LAZ67_20002002 [Cordylochernes scorpioides]|uniref:Uncharacterized protein n=1 Tax=Cordylochernes scorpioides TaxID=51811 RepID=A0ABY6LKL1_9ARAC|nr:hypothetical protein LAZ67_20002002 [Cordylochernes scorpioides]